VDDTVIFRRLTREHIRRIVEIQLVHLRARLSERDITLELSDEALAYLARQSDDPAYGARPLKRLIQKELQDRSALSLLRGGIPDGDTVWVEGEGLGLRVGRPGRRRSKAGAAGGAD
jgi:ATP-dependent Clp protease ATP-binding subunit ClpB